MYWFIIVNTFFEFFTQLVYVQIASSETDSIPQVYLT